MYSRGFFIICYLLLFIISSCSQNRNSEINNGENTELKYAQLFRVVNFNNYKMVYFYHPDDYSVIDSFALVRRGINVHLNEDVKQIEIPIRSIGIFSVPHIGYLEKLNQLSSITAVENKKLIDNKILKRYISSGKVKQLHSVYDINPIMLKKNNIEVFTYGGMFQDLLIENKLNKLNIKSIATYEWCENHPLGRSEWIKLFGALFDKEDEAKIEFHKIESEYNFLVNKVKDLNLKKVTVLTGNVYNDVWHIPQKDNYSNILFSNANAEVAGSEFIGNKSQALSFENILKKYKNSDFWFNVNCTSKKELLAQNEKYKYFKAFEKDQCYTYFHNSNKFWELSAVQPQKVLADIIHIIYRDLNSEYKYEFYKKID